jgi:Ca2+-transporting ATPase
MMKKWFRKTNRSVEDKEDELTTFLNSIKIVYEFKLDQRFFMAQTMKKANKVCCFTGNTIGESFAMKEANVGLSMQNCGNDVAKKASDLILHKCFTIILLSIMLGRNIYENLRKFLQFQAVVSVNLTMYVVIGSLLFRDWPI